MNWFVPIVLIGVLLIITLLLIIADKYLGAGGEKTLNINDEKPMEVPGGDTLLNTLSKKKIYIPSACGGKATCGVCKVRILDPVPDVKPTEEPHLTSEEKSDGVRLSCQVKLRQSMHIEVPEDKLNAEEYKAKVVNVEDLTYDTKLVRFELIKPKEMNFLPGQYAQWRIPGVEVIRAYSIASDPKENNSVEFIVRLVPGGQATTFVHRAMRMGDTLTLTGPFGDFYLREDSNKDIICIAGGSGKAPIRSIVRRLEALGMPRKVRYFFGARTTKDLYYTEEFNEVAKKYENFDYIPALSHPEDNEQWEGETGLITDVLDRLSGDLSESEAYLCGSPGMIDACIKVLEKHNVKSENVYYDKFTG